MPRQPAPQQSATLPRAIILGCAGPELSAAEREFFGRADPLGFILFARNCETPEQVRDLVAALRATVGRADAPVLIDQEGGRVQRLGPPHWPALPTGRAYATLAETDFAAATTAAKLHGRLLAADLAPLGITVDCAPVADILRPETHEVIGDRAYGPDPEQVGLLAEAVCVGLLAGGVLPVIKHIPGHGRAGVDSHAELPVVETSREELNRTDFVPFRRLAAMPWAMSAHVVYTAVDGDNPASTSTLAIRRLIRRDIGFGGILISDDIGMQALQGGMAERARACLAAGCDLTLHCSGDMAEMEDAIIGTRRLRPIAAKWLEQAERRRGDAAEKMPFDAVAAKERLDAMLAGGAD